MKKLILLFTLIVTMFVTSSCTENARTRRFGGTQTINLPKGKKVTMATWKDSNLFYMVEDMEDSYVPKTKELIEDSSFGILTSKVVFIESK